MNLRESLEPSHGPPHEAPLPPPQDLRWLTGLAMGWGLATGREMAVTCNGPTMRLHDLTNDRRSPVIARGGKWNEEALMQCFRFHIEHIDHWIPESDNWGPDPWHAPPEPTP